MVNYLKFKINEQATKNYIKYVFEQPIKKFNDTNHVKIKEIKINLFEFIQNQFIVEISKDLLKKCIKNNCIETYGEFTLTYNFESDDLSFNDIYKNFEYAYFYINEDFYNIVSGKYDNDEVAYNPNLFIEIFHLVERTLVKEENISFLK